MAASDPDVTTAKGRLDKQGGEPDTGYISPSDIQTAFDDLQSGWTADIDAPRDATITDSDAAYTTHVDIEDDGTATNTWPDRFRFSFEQGQGTGNFARTGWFNEFGEIRAASATANTVAMRAHGHTGGDSTNDIFQVMDQTGGNVLFGVANGGVCALNNDGNDGRALTIDRTVAGSGDIFQIRYQGSKKTYTNSTGQLRTSSAGHPTQEAFAVTADSSQSNNIFRVANASGGSALRVNSAGAVLVDDEPVMTVADLQAVVAASSDFADFQSRVAAL